MSFVSLHPLKVGDKVAIVSPSFAAPGVFKEVYELGLQRLREEFGLEPVTFPATTTVGASAEDRTADLVAAFTDPEIKAVIASIGGDDQVTYIYDMDPQPFIANPKPFFGFSDNTHFAHFLWQHGVPSYYGGSLFTQFAMLGGIDPFTKHYLHQALFMRGTVSLEAAEQYNDVNLDWGDPASLTKTLSFEANDGWYWDGDARVSGITWGGCVESIDDMLRHNVPLPLIEDWKEMILLLETSEELPSASQVSRVLRALGERGYLEHLRGVLVGRPKAWEFALPNPPDVKANYRSAQRATVLKTVRAYNTTAPIVQNLDFGHTNPQIPMPYGRMCVIDADALRLEAEF
jgi:muramoyltetrapeptide carboxypeptidase LdcA involved in peptidoglycan recycling